MPRQTGEEVVKRLYVKLILMLIRPALDAYNEQRVSERAKLRLVEQTQDIRRRVKSGELHL